MTNDNKTEIGAAGVGEVATASLSRFPQFLSSQPKLYFIQMDAFMKLNRVSSDETKFQYVCAMAPPELHPHMLEVVNDETPPEQRTKTQYEQFKERVMQSFDRSAESRVRELLQQHGLGNQKPSQYLLSMKNLAAGECNDRMLKSLFLEQLPEWVRSILVVADEDDLTKLAALADKIMESSPRAAYPVVTELHGEAQLPAPAIMAITSSNEALRQLITRLEQQVRELREEVRGEQRSRSRSRSQHNSRQRSSSRRSNGLCFYHSKHGASAIKCVAPCNWPKRNNNQDSEN